ncbi:hypothetical protein Mgra_00010005 [Meloidogyne graminicola]|uniref:Protein-S-isoprenylcysteine O-methyltransferase n=1 Tax=Meloidogyne graminicola TaxID=189291 RepID=A0A8S9ZCT8_9BILA|nr:hypothetical protein Mgra_00010005 [Meloidogyne graminicola]
MYEHSQHSSSTTPSLSDNSISFIANSSSLVSSQSLEEHSWYWSKATKEEISAAMENQPTGTFAVRDSSTKGQYTLTLRVDGTNKLIKILIENGRCGFTPDSMDFDSMASLVQFYQTCSLRDFNEKLDTCLLYPLKSPQSIACKLGVKSDSMMDPSYRVNLLKCTFEAIHAEYDRISRRYDQLFNQQLSLTEEYNRKQRTESAYADALKIFERKIGELKTTISEENELNDRDRESLTMNIELQEERMEEIGKAQTLMKAAIQNIEISLQKINDELARLKPSLLNLHKKCEKYRDKLFEVSKQKVTHAQLDRLVQSVSLALDSEPSTLSTFLLRISLPISKWCCECWLWHQATKDESISLIRSLMKDFDNSNASTDGIFLIRPSSSRVGFYALEISKNDNVHSCLIEYRDPRTTIDHSGGYGFAQTQMLFASLMDFVRYYSAVPLKEHNSVLDTPLITPALGQLKHRKERQNNSLITNDNQRDKTKLKRIEAVDDETELRTCIDEKIIEKRMSDFSQKFLLSVKSNRDNKSSNLRRLIYCLKDLRVRVSLFAYFLPNLFILIIDPYNLNIFIFLIIISILGFISIYSTQTSRQRWMYSSQSFLLGLVNGLAIKFALNAYKTGNSIVITFCLYVVLFCLFHFSEFFMTAFSNPDSLKPDSFLLNHSLEYWTAALCSWVEFWIRLWAFPSKFFTSFAAFYSPFVSLFGLILCIVGEIFRKLAMCHASVGFTHQISFRRSRNHHLCTGGVYALVRHPGYMGWMLWSIGTQLVLCNPICLIFYVCIGYRFLEERIYEEEKYLIEFFAERYIAYQRYVPCGIPGIKGYESY